MEKKAKKKAIADSGFLYALINKKDPHHESARISARKYDYQWITTCFVFHEVFVLLNDRKPRFLHLIPNLFQMVNTGLLEVVSFDKSQFATFEMITAKYKNIYKHLDLADASLIMLAERIGQGDIFTVDIKDFSTCRWDGNKPFKILVESTN